MFQIRLKSHREVKMSGSAVFYVVMFVSLLCQTLAQFPGGIGEDVLNEQIGEVSGQSANWVLLSKIVQMEERMNDFQGQMNQMSRAIQELQDKLNPGAIDGQWGDWGPLSACSISCMSYGNNTTGTQTRSRSCDNPAPANGGHDCQGNGTESISCIPNTTCPMSPAPLRPGDAIGGNGGYGFSDDVFWNNNPVTGIRMQCGRVLVSMQLKYGDRWGLVRGGGESIWCEFPTTYNVDVDFAPDEYVVAINSTYNNYINSVALQTNKRNLRKCGTTTGANVKNLQGTRMLYISGRKGCYIDRLNLHWAA